MSRWLMLSVAMVVLAAVTSLFLWIERTHYLPEVVVTHRGWHGQADALTSREAVLPYLFLMPAWMAGLVVLTVVLPWLSPRSFKVDSFRSVYDRIMALTVALFGYLHGVILASFIWSDFNPTRYLFAGLFLFFALLAPLLGHVHRNFWMGVRTPWTLASEEVWDRTHRLAAWLFGAAGLAGFLAVVLGGPMWALWACFSLLLAAALTPVVYSAVLYKHLERTGRLPRDSQQGSLT